MSVTTGVSRSDALAAVVRELCHLMLPERRWLAVADDPRLRWQGWQASADLVCLVNAVDACDRSSKRGMTVQQVGGEECCHRFSWDEIFAACDGAPRQAGLL